MRHAEILLLLTALPLLGAEAPKPASEKEKAREQAWAEVLAGSERGPIKRRNLIKRFGEVMAARRKERARLIEEGRQKALRKARQSAREAMEKAYAREAAQAAEGLLRLAGQVRDDWEAMRKAETEEVAQLKSDRAAQAAWVHRRGFTRSGTEQPAAAFIFSDERCRPVDPKSMAYLKSLGFNEEEGEVILLVLELDEQVADRAEAAARS